MLLGCLLLVLGTYSFKVVNVVVGSVLSYSFLRGEEIRDRARLPSSAFISNSNNAFSLQAISVSASRFALFCF